MRLVASPNAQLRRNGRARPSADCLRIFSMTWGNWAPSQLPMEAYPRTSLSVAGPSIIAVACSADDGNNSEVVWGQWRGESGRTTACPSCQIRTAWAMLAAARLPHPVSPTSSALPLSLADVFGCVEHDDDAEARPVPGIGGFCGGSVHGTGIASHALNYLRVRALPRHSSPYPSPPLPPSWR